MKRTMLVLMMLAGCQQEKKPSISGPHPYYAEIPDEMRKGYLDRPYLDYPRMPTADESEAGYWMWPVND